MKRRGGKLLLGLVFRASLAFLVLVWLVHMRLTQEDQGRVPPPPPQAKKLVERIAQATSVAPADVAKVFAALGPAVAEHLQRGETTLLPGIGSLQREIEGAYVQDPATKEIRFIPSRVTVRFEPSEKLIERLNQNGRTSQGTEQATPYVRIPPLPQPSQ